MYNLGGEEVSKLIGTKYKNASENYVYRKNVCGKLQKLSKEWLCNFSIKVL